MGAGAERVSFEKLRMAVPLPPAGATQYPFDQLEVGEAADIKNRTVKAVRSAITSYVKKHPGAKFTARRITATSCRVWRVT